MQFSFFRDEQDSREEFEGGPVRVDLGAAWFDRLNMNGGEVADDD